MILFQDFDGVLNSNSFIAGWIDENSKSIGILDTIKQFRNKFCVKFGKAYRVLQPDLVNRFNRFINENNNIEIVCSSSWRIGHSLSQIKDFYKDNGLPYEQLIGSTPVLYGKYVHVSRNDEIKAYIEEHNLRDQFCMSIDDSMVYDSKDLPKFKAFTIDSNVGLTENIIVQMQKWIDRSKSK